MNPKKKSISKPTIKSLLRKIKLLEKRITQLECDVDYLSNNVKYRTSKDELWGVGI